MPISALAARVGIDNRSGLQINDLEGNRDAASPHKQSADPHQGSSRDVLRTTSVFSLHYIFDLIIGRLFVNGYSDRNLLRQDC